jgi:DNA replication protein DnaC
MLQSVACLVGVGKTHLACALGHIAIRRRRTVHMAPAARLFKRLKAARLDNTLEYEMRRLAGVELLILDLSGVPCRPSVTSASVA